MPEFKHRVLEYGRLQDARMLLLYFPIQVILSTQIEVRVDHRSANCEHGGLDVVRRDCIVKPFRLTNQRKEFGANQHAVFVNRQFGAYLVDSD